MNRKEQLVTRIEPRVPFENKFETEGTVSLQPAESDQLDEIIKTMMDSTNGFITSANGQRKRASICKVCGKEAKDADVRRHIEAKHMNNISHSCDICGKISRSRNGLRQHVDKERKNKLLCFRTRDGLAHHKYKQHNK